MADPMILEFKDVSYQRGGKTILNHITFRQPENLSIGILGARGSGKSTIMELALGVNPPSHGRIRRRGRLSMPIGFPATLHRLMSGREITRITAGLYGVDPDTLCHFVEDFAELGPAFRKPLGRFNAIQRSRFVFTLSYAIPADCYVADGKLFGGDRAFRTKCLNLALARKKEAAFFFTTQSPRDMRSFADVGAVLQKGGLTFYPSVDDAITAYIGETGQTEEQTALDDEDEDMAELDS